MNKIKVNWFIPVKHRNYNKMPASVWIRCLQLIPYLENKNINCMVNQPDTPADISIFVRWQNEQALSVMKKCKAKGQKVIFDLCVNYLEPTGTIGEEYGSSDAQKQQVLKMIRTADMVTCASDYIKNIASQYHQNSIYIPDSIDMNHFNMNKSVEDFSKKTLTLVYAGVAAKSVFLFEHIFKFIKKSGMNLLLLSETKPRLFAKYKYKKWKYQTFPHDMMIGDIGIAPRRTDDPYDMGHSNIKIGFFLAQGIPVIASQVQSYKEFLGQGTAGKICDSI